MIAGPPPLQVVVVPPSVRMGAAVDLRHQVLPVVNDGPRLYLLHLGRQQVGRSSARHSPSASPPPQLT
jgi:hypothetical protein